MLMVNDIIKIVSFNNGCDILSNGQCRYDVTVVLNIKFFTSLKSRKKGVDLIYTSTVYVNVNLDQ